ncbi:MAG: histidine triad nucleotide-binding protein [Pirellula sp.]|jgi:histidine triad (HIT) family protein|nr:histidine triad nucleotide-binding protein [Pirellula sp.]
MSETIFSKILRKEIPATVLYEDDLVMAFQDIHPQAPVHFLVIPKQPIVSLDSISGDDRGLLGHLQWVASKVAREQGLSEGGYRVVTNIGSHGGQSVSHLHYHVLGGRPMAWPPG